MAGRYGFFKLGVRLGFGFYKKGSNSRFWFSVILVPCMNYIPIQYNIDIKYHLLVKKIHPFTSVHKNHNFVSWFCSRHVIPHVPFPRYRNCNFENKIWLTLLAVINYDPCFGLHFFIASKAQILMMRNHIWVLTIISPTSGKRHIRNLL